MFVDICRIVIELYSKKFFKETFYEYLLELHTDSVPNIRLNLCSILPDLKRLLILPTDRGLLQQLDACVRKLLVAEKDKDVTDGVQSALEELDKIHIPMQSVSLKILQNMQFTKECSGLNYSVYGLGVWCFSFDFRWQEETYLNKI